VAAVSAALNLQEPADWSGSATQDTMYWTSIGGLHQRAGGLAVAARILAAR
jgi:hypothetical protein